jgi:glycosyltransferase involved in cell wall biosynthesis
MEGFSLIICTHNPKKIIFSRLLDSLERLDKSQLKYEIIIIDNNSLIPISSLNYVSHFLNKNPSAKLIVESNPGLTSARLLGIRNAKFDWLIFFDDDNEPSVDYLVNTYELIEKYSYVGAWGPGIIDVEYEVDQVPLWFQKNKFFFQETLVDETIFDKKENWCDCYPNGTGLIIKKEIALFYKSMIENNCLTMTDRIGKSLISGGDTQMVLCGIKLGYCAGVSPELSLKHLICFEKIKMQYILKQVYMTASCFVKTFNEINFANNKIKIVMEGNIRVFQILYFTIRVKFFSTNLNDSMVYLYSRLGEVNARYFASGNNRKPKLLRFFEILINV